MFINFNEIYKKENSTRLIILGVILLAIGVKCISRKTMGVKVFSWGMAITLLYITWLCLKEINQLKRYVEKKEVNKFRLIGFLSVILAALLLIFPMYTNIVLSIAFGVYILYFEIADYLSNRRFAYYSLTSWKLIKVVLAILLIVSPLFLSRFMVTIFSIVSIVFGLNFLTYGLGIKNNERY